MAVPGDVDVMVLRDVIERNAISNPVALRWMQRHLLASPAAPFSIEKLHSALRSQGIPVGKDSLHAYLAHLEDAFLIATVSLHTDSERKRMVHPRKAYPIDPGFIPLFERMGSPSTPQAIALLISLDGALPDAALPTPLRWMPATRWLLEDEDQG